MLESSSLEDAIARANVGGATHSEGQNFNVGKCVSSGNFFFLLCSPSFCSLALFLSCLAPSLDPALSLSHSPSISDVGFVHFGVNPSLALACTSCYGWLIWVVAMGVAMGTLDFGFDVSRLHGHARPVSRSLPLRALLRASRVPLACCRANDFSSRLTLFLARSRCIARPRVHC